MVKKVIVKSKNLANSSSGATIGEMLLHPIMIAAYLLMGVPIGCVALIGITADPTPTGVCYKAVEAMPGFTKIFKYDTWRNKYTDDIVDVEFEVGFRNNNGGYHTRVIHCVPEKKNGKWVATFPGL